MKKEIYHIPGKVVGHHHPEINAIIDTWDSLLISLADWKASVYDIGITDYAPKHGVTVWVIDTSRSHGVFKTEVQEFRENVARPKLIENGVKFLFVIQPQSALGRLAVKRTATLYQGQGSMKAYSVASLEEALTILRKEKEVA